MTSAREYLKILAVIPVIFLFNINEIFSSEMEGTPPATLLSYKIFSSTTSLDTTMFVLTIGNLYFLFLFNLLYGAYIFNDANNCGAYIFSRLKDRRGWFYGKVKTMVRFSVCYIALVMVCFSAISIWQSRKWPDGRIFAVAAIMTVFFTALAALTTTAVSVLSFRVGSVPAFLTVYLIEAVLVLSLLIPPDTAAAKAWNYINPFGGIFSLEHVSAKIVLQICYIAGLLAALTYAGGRYIARMDIGLKNVEVE
jgi:hypothetical protein